MNPTVHLAVPTMEQEPTRSAPEWGMASFLVSEVAFFSTLVVTYFAFLGKDVVGPVPDQVLSWSRVILATAFLLTSSATIHLAEWALSRRATCAFCFLWGATIVLGVAFLVGTALEWRELMVHHGLTISRNLFGTTFYTLVGFHALHVTVGVIALLVILGMSIRGDVQGPRHQGVTLVGWYWHFVDAVWVVVFLVVYVFGRGGGLA